MAATNLNLADAFRSQNLVYRAVENNESDRKFLHEQIVSDPASIALSDPGLVRPPPQKHTESMVEEVNKSLLSVMICLPPDGNKQEPTPIGFLSLGWGGIPPTQLQHRKASIGIELAAPYQGKGYGGEAINWTLDWAFRFAGLHRVSIGTVDYNERAKHLYQKLGFVEEGRHRQAHWHDRRWWDTVSFAMLEDEWAALRGLA